jgi:hypothetical protein
LGWEPDVTVRSLSVDVVALLGLDVLGVKRDQLPIAQQPFPIVGISWRAKKCTKYKHRTQNSSDSRRNPIGHGFTPNEMHGFREAMIVLPHHYVRSILKNSRTSAAMA